MADSTIKALTAQTTILATDILYVVDETEGVPADENKKVTMPVLAVYVNAVRPTVINSDTNLYVQWEAGADNYTVTRLADGYWATVTNNPTETTSAGAWTNRATLVYTVNGL